VLSLSERSARIEVRAVPDAGDLVFGDPPRWHDLEWHERETDGAAVIAVSERVTEAELRVRIEDYPPAYLRLVGADLAAACTVIPIRLRAGRGALVGDNAHDPYHCGEPIGFGLRSGDVVERVGERAVACESELRAALAAASSIDPLTLSILRGAVTLVVTLPVGWRDWTDRLRFAVGPR
jgi:hypothetical protein